MYALCQWEWDLTVVRLVWCEADSLGRLIPPLGWRQL